MIDPSPIFLCFKKRFLQEASNISKCLLSYDLHSYEKTKRVLFVLAILSSILHMEADGHPKRTNDVF